MSAYLVSVFSPLPYDHILVNVLTVQVDRPIEWMKQHADELAQKRFPGLKYIALNVAPA